MESSIKTMPFNIKASIEKAQKNKRNTRQSTLVVDGNIFVWSNRLERVQVIRQGIPYSALLTISKKMNSPVKKILNIIGVPQTTYNKKKAKHSLLEHRDAELILRISELIDYGHDVFNEDKDKFYRWLNKPNISLGGVSPIELLDTISGVNEVKFCLDRIEYGNFA